ncbi:unnamed protein product [Penicillium egyptiacum]|uniref:Uncharacterized protein n=1 Tax=Penicillium egyptiacum TaxID=1303716 RepID=A0A9W4KFK0_9EURO|nr:unnamed protein product [Penicillium egyptiacum]
MDPADVELNVEVGDEDLFIESISTGVKRKRDNVSTHTQARPAAESIGPSAWDLSSVYWNSLNFTPASTIDESRLTRLGTENPDRSPPPKRELLDVMPPLDLDELPDPPSETNNFSSRVWESHRPSSLNFTIYEDPLGKETPSPSPMEQGFQYLEEDKENIYLTHSDLGSSGEEEEEDTMPNLAWNEASAGPRDAFGLPLNREMSDFVSPRDTPFPEPHMRRGRQVLRTLWVDETQVRPEDNALSNAQIREIEETEAMYRRGRARNRSNRYQVREDTLAQAPTDFTYDVRRVLFQRHEDRRPVTPERNEDIRPVTSEESEEEPQQQESEQEQEPEQEQ